MYIYMISIMHKANYKSNAFGTAVKKEVFHMENEKKGTFI